MKQLVVYSSYTEQTEIFAMRVMNEFGHAVRSSTLFIANKYTASSTASNTIPCEDASIRLYFVSKAALENIGIYKEIQMLLNSDDKNSNVFFLSSSSLGRTSNKDAVKFYVSRSCYDASMFFSRYRFYSLIYERLYGLPNQHSYLIDPADQYWHGMWILANNFNSFNDLGLAQDLLEQSANASNMFALNYVGYSLCCGAVPFDIDEKRGIELMMRAADMGHPIGILNVGKYLWQQGEHQKGVSLLQRGLYGVEDDGGAYSLLAESYAEGLGVSKNSEKALRYTMLSKALRMKNSLKQSIDYSHLWRNMAIISEILF